jgi:hypothetical protein
MQGEVYAWMCGARAATRHLPIRSVEPLSLEQVHALFPELLCKETNAVAVKEHLSGAYNHPDNPVPPRVQPYLDKDKTGVASELWMTPANADMVTGFLVYGNDFLVNDTSVMMSIAGTQRARITPMAGELTKEEINSRAEAELARQMGGRCAIFPVFIDDYILFDVPQTEKEAAAMQIIQVTRLPTLDTETGDGGNAKKAVAPVEPVEPVEPAKPEPWKPIEMRYEVVWRGGLITPLPVSLINITPYPPMLVDPA